MYYIQTGYYEKGSSVEGFYPSHDLAMLHARSIMRELDPNHEWVNMYPDCPTWYDHFHVERKPEFPYVMVNPWPFFDHAGTHAHI